ncbi:GDSL-type esterase/lipase family protein [Bacillus cihuensis]|uniref:GDSL-type esterase/lipase family protein n=1 Tax=Bacillus cihuensis TaxID=1208599 RepID=UPI00041AA752|nr:GDSL-type esterase/lipase family protein [Bacillus cihuensis]
MIVLGKKSVRYITIIATTFSILWLLSFGWAIQNYYAGASNNEIKKQVNPKTIENKDQAFTIVALGDSLTRGTGDDSGKGYVGYVIDDLKQRFNGHVIVHNLAINGQVSSQLKEQVKQQNIQRQLAFADTIFLSIGANDLFQQGRTLENFDSAAIKIIKQNFIDNMRIIFADIRKVNSDAPIFFVGLYNPFFEADHTGVTSPTVHDWNRTAEDMSSSDPRIVFVPTFDIFQLFVNDYLYSDKFHPNQQGYRLIANRISPFIKWEGEGK